MIKVRKRLSILFDITVFLILLLAAISPFIYLIVAIFNNYSVDIIREDILFYISMMFVSLIASSILDSKRG